MSVGSTSKSKLFVLRIATDNASKVIVDNTLDLSKELDRGWTLGPYEVILADPDSAVCHILIRLTTTLSILAAPPATPPTPVPPPEKLFVLHPDFGSPSGRYVNQDVLAAEIDRGWVFECYEVVLASPADSCCFILVKLSNSKNVPATIPRA